MTTPLRQLEAPQLETLRLEAVDDELIWLVLDRPRVLNAMSVQMRHEMPVALAAVAEGPWRVLLIRGEGRAFCAGADLTDFPREVDVTDRADVRAAVEGWHAVIRAIRALPQASVAAIHGPVYGGGANLALAADVVIAGESLRMVQSYVVRKDEGASPRTSAEKGCRRQPAAMTYIGASVDLGGSWLLPRLAGMARGRRLLLTGEAVDAQRALDWGLVSEVVPDEDLVDHAQSLGRVLAAKDPDVLRAIRGTIDRGAAASLDAHLDDEAEAVASMVVRAAFVEGTSRFTG